MSALTDNVQIIEENGKPAFAVIPYVKFIEMKRCLENPAEALVPHEVVKMNIIDGVSMIKAWRKYLGMTQAELAGKAGISQAALSQMEKPETVPQAATLKKIATAMGLRPEHFS